MMTDTTDRRTCGIVFIAHDPGGYDVIMPIYRQISGSPGVAPALFLTGPAGGFDERYKKTEQEALTYLNRLIRNGEDFILVTGTSWNSSIEPEAIRLCRDHSITTIAILDYWCNYKERFRMGDDYAVPDYYFMMDDLAVREATACGMDPSAMIVVGQPGLDKYVKRRVVSYEAGKSILFLSQPLSAIYGDRLGYDEYSVAEDILRAGEELGYSVNIKFHPKETEGMREKYGHLEVEGTLEDIAGEFGVVIGMSTMGLLQCCLMGIPVISYEPNLAVKDVCIINRLGIAGGAFSYAELVQQLGTPDRAKDISYPFWCDGRSTERCVDTIMKICRQPDHRYTKQRG